MALPSKGSQPHAFPGCIPAFQSGAEQCWRVRGEADTPCIEACQPGPVRTGVPNTDACGTQAREVNAPSGLDGSSKRCGN